MFIALCARRCAAGALSRVGVGRRLHQLPIRIKAVEDRFLVPVACGTLAARRAIMHPGAVTLPSDLT